MKKSTKKQPLTLHGLLGSLTYWGTATRGLLFGFVALMVSVIALSEASTARMVDNELHIMIYVLASFFVLDLGYVLISRTYQIVKALDFLALMVAELLLLVLYVVPKLVVNPAIVLKVDPLTYVLFVPIVALGLRMLVGLLYGKRAR